MSDNNHVQHLLNAEQARQGLAADLRKMNTAGESLIRHGKHGLKSAALTHGVATLGGLVIGAALGRMGTGRRGNRAIAELMGRATAAFATALATQLLAKLFTKRS